MYKYKYISLLDIDEVIIPLAGSNWSEMMSLIKKNLTDAEQIASFSFKHVYFGDWMEEETKDSEIPSYFHILRHVQRGATYANSNLKSFMNTDQAQSQTLKTVVIFRIMTVHNVELCSFDECLDPTMVLSHSGSLIYVE